MAHPSKNLPKNTYYLDDANALTAPEGRHFFSITALSGGTVTVKGGGVFEYLASGVPGTGHIDPSTGAAFDGNTAAAGYYEALPATEVEVTLSAGQTLFGRFTYVEGGAATQYLVYA